MILSFKSQFKEKVLSGEKIHTIREDKSDRWQPDKTIHFATGVRSKNYNCFKEGVCVSVNPILITPKERKVTLWEGDIPFDVLEQYRVDRELDWKRREAFCRNDGFDSEQKFWEWFNKPFQGKLISWTNFKYFYGNE